MTGPLKHKTSHPQVDVQVAGGDDTKPRVVVPSSSDWSSSPISFIWWLRDRSRSFGALWLL